MFSIGGRLWEVVSYEMVAHEGLTSYFLFYIYFFFVKKEPLLAKYIVQTCI